MLACSANRSRRPEGDTEGLRGRFAVLEAFGEDTKGEGLGMSNRLVPGGTVGEDARQVRDLGDPSTVALLLQFDA